MKATNGHKAKLHVLASKLNFDTFDLHAFINERTGKTSIKELTTTEAGRCIGDMERKLTEAGVPNIPDTRVTGAMRGKILKYKHLLKMHDVHFWNFVRKVVGHDVPVASSNHVRFNWLTKEDGYKVLEGLKAIYGRR
ncbi:MAG: phage protein GemA/Gp16 family protein [bacterium]